MNYKVIMSYGREEVITETQRNNLVEALGKGASGFISLNGIFVQAKDIRIIEPTKDKTGGELATMQHIQLEDAAKYQENTVVANKWLTFSDSWMDKKFGAGAWDMKMKTHNLQEIKQSYNRS